jgi:nucleotide-binding universal stress UspA family protein
MEQYKHILIGVDLYVDFDDSIVERGMAIAHEYNAKVTLLHTIEHVNAYGIAQAYPTVIEVEEQMRKESEQKLQKYKESMICL